MFDFVENAQTFDIMFHMLAKMMIPTRGSAVAQWSSVGFRSERSGVRNLPPPCCVHEQDTLLPESTG